MNIATASRRLFARCCVSFLGLLLAVPVAAQPFFTDVTEQAGLHAFPGRSARSVVFVDYDNDGFQDVFITENEFSQRRIGLFHNTGNGRFVDQTFRVPADLHVTRGGSGAIFGDYDDDGDEDLFLPVWPHNVLLRNDRGLFTQVDPGSALTDSLYTDSAIWLDYDRDGYLDLYVSSLAATETYAPRANRLLRNNGDDTFTDQTAVAGLDIFFEPEWGGSGGGLAAGDFNDDGWPDLYVGVKDYSNRLFLSDSQGSFRDATSGEIADEGEAFGIAVGDINNDGNLDIFQPAGGSNEPGFRSLMLLNLGDGQFLDVTESMGLSLDVLGSSTDGTAFADVDNDGDLDLVIGLAVKGSWLEPLLLLNDGTGVFVDHTAASGIEDYGPYIAVGDYDEDGFVDLLYASFTREVTALYRNNGNDNHWLRVELAGIESNRNGIGSRLLATSGELAQMRQILGGRGRQEDERVAHFGLGTRTQVDRLEIRWPSGQVYLLTDIPADQKIRVIEGQDTYHPVGPTVWITPPPAALIAGVTSPILAVVRPALFESQAQISRVTADLSALGGPDAVPLREVGDGTYRLEVELTPSNLGVQELSLSIEQTTAAGPHWVRLVEDVEVFPGGDLPIWDGGPGSWQVESRGRVEELDLTQRSEVYRDDVAAAIQVEKTFSPWKVTFRPDRSVPRRGFRTLRFAFHPGDANLETGANLYVILEPGKATDLLDRVDAERREWQVVEIPLQATAQDEPIETVSFTGTFGGTFFLDAIELIATVLPEADLPVFAEALHDGWTVRPEWLLNLTRHPANDLFPAWSPDGQRVTFYSSRDGNAEIYVMNADGSNPVNLTNHPTSDRNPSWSPDGSRIAFRSLRDGHREVYVMNADGSNLANLTNHPAEDSTPSWSPDGSQMVFATDRWSPHRIYEICVMEVDPTERVTVHPTATIGFEDLTSLQVRTDATGAWRVLCQPSSPLDITGYDALHFAFHPGDTRVPESPSLRVSTRQGEIDLLAGVSEEMEIDLELRDWQVVELPLEMINIEGRIAHIAFSGNLAGTFYLDDIRLVKAMPTITAVTEEQVGLPGRFALEQNYPNPFNRSTMIRFALPENAAVTLEVFNLLGQKVATLMEGAREAGTYTLRWEGRDDDGRALASGVYLYRLRTGDGTQVETRKLVLMK